MGKSLLLGFFKFLLPFESSALHLSFPLHLGQLLLFLLFFDFFLPLNFLLKVLKLHQSLIVIVAELQHLLLFFKMFLPENFFLRLSFLDQFFELLNFHFLDLRVRLKVVFLNQGLLFDFEKLRKLSLALLDTLLVSRNLGLDVLGLVIDRVHVLSLPHVHYKLTVAHLANPAFCQFRPL